MVFILRFRKCYWSVLFLVVLENTFEMFQIQVKDPCVWLIVFQIPA